MSKIDKISVAITREQHAKIKAAIDRGDYASTSEVIRTALREWELKEEMRRLEGTIARRGTRHASGRTWWSQNRGRLRAKYAALERRRWQAIAQGRMSYQLSPRRNRSGGDWRLHRRR
jgi:Arc/MetJ-type ribon-helix-helix transcriptional regulator